MPKRVLTSRSVGAMPFCHFDKSSVFNLDVFQPLPIKLRKADPVGRHRSTRRRMRSFFLGGRRLCGPCSLSPQPRLVFRKCVLHRWLAERMLLFGMPPSFLTKLQLTPASSQQQLSSLQCHVQSGEAWDLPRMRTMVFAGWLNALSLMKTVGEGGRRLVGCSECS